MPIPAIAGPIAIAILREVVPAVIRAAQRPDVPINAERAHEAATAVAREVEKALPRIPEVVHSTNQEPWYQSRVTIGALITMASGATALFGVSLAPEDVNLITNVALGVGAVAGGCITLYGRWKAKRPIGTKPTTGTSGGLF